MEIVFVEYKVFPEKRGAYLDWVRGISASHPELEHYEGTDQPNLFVELWHGFGQRQYLDFKRNRTELPVDPWSGLADFVPGGLAKVHIWHFRRTMPVSKPT